MIDRRARELLERSQCDWVEAWARAVAEQQVIDDLAASDTEDPAARSPINRAGRVSLSEQIGLAIARRPGSVAPGRATLSRALPAAVMRSAERADIDPGAAELVTRARHGGAPLDAALRSRLETALGARLDGVRVHTGADADAAARALGARAFAIGDDVVFRDGAYDPGRREGQRLIAHEVAHTVQARGAPAPTGGTTHVSQSGDASEREADAFADAFVRSVGLGWDEPIATSTASAARDRAPAAPIADDRVRPAPSGRIFLERDETSPAPAARAGAAPAPAPGAGPADPATPAAPAPAGGAPAHDGPPAAHAAGDPPPPSGGDHATGTPPAPGGDRAQGAQPAPGGDHAGAPHAAPGHAAPPGHDAPAPGDHAPHGDDAGGDHAPAHGHDAPPAPGPFAGPIAGAGGEPTTAAPPNAKLKAAADQIRNAARTEKAAFTAAAKTQSAAVEAEVQARAGVVEASGAAHLKTLLAQIATRQAEIKTTFATARAALKQKIAQQKLAARGDGETALRDLKQAVEDQKKAATDAANAEADLMDKAGTRESGRATKSATDTVSAVNAAKSAAAGSYAGKDEKVRSAVREALDKAAADVIADVQKKGGDLSRSALDSSAKVSRSIRGAGAKLASEIGGKTGDLEKAIRDGTKQAVEKIDQLGTQSADQLDKLESKATAALAKAKAAAQPAVDSAVKRSAAQLRTEGKQAVAQIHKAEASTAAEFDKATDAVLGKLNAIDAGEDVSGASIGEFTTAATTKLAEARATGVTGINTQGGKLVGGLAGVTAGFDGKLTAGVAQVKAKIDEATDALKDARNLPSTVEDRCKEICKETKKGYDDGIKKFRTDGQKQVTDARADWTKQRSKVEDDIKTKVDDCVAKNSQLAAQAPAKFAETGRAACAEAEKSWAARVWSGIKSGLLKFAKGLGIFLLALVVVFVIVLAVLVIGALLAGTAITLALVAKALAIALLIVGAVFLVVGLVMAIINRFGSFWQALGNMPLWQKILLTVVCSVYLLAVSIGDVFGVSGIIEWLIGHDLVTWRKLSTEEQWERLTVGVLTVLTILLFKRANAKLPPVRMPWSPRVPGTDPPGRTPGVDPRPGDPAPGDPARPGDPADPNPATPPDPANPATPPDPANPANPRPVDPAGPRPADPPDPVRPPDPNLPPGYDPSTRTFPELQADRARAPRPGETQAQAQARARAAEAELLRRAPEIIDALGENPRRVNPRVEDVAREPDGAHTTGPNGRHGADIPLRRVDNPGGKTIEGRLFGDPPWRRAERASMKWLSDSIMVRVINEYIRANWDQIRTDLALNGEHEGGGVAGSAIGEGFVNSGTAAAPQPTYSVSSLFTIRLRLLPGPPVDFFVVTGFPSPMGVP